MTVIDWMRWLSPLSALLWMTLALRRRVQEQNRELERLREELLRLKLGVPDEPKLSRENPGHAADAPKAPLPQARLIER